MVAEDLGEDPPFLQPPMQRLMPHPHPDLHRPLLRCSCVVSMAFNLICVAAEALVSLDLLAWLKELHQTLIYGIFILCDTILHNCSKDYFF